MKCVTTCTKVFHNLPFAHRQHNHDGHCRLIHGHNWSFELTFAAAKLDENLFVVDFGKLKWLRAFLEDHFDHTLVLNQDDPWLKYLINGLTPAQEKLASDEQRTDDKPLPPLFAKIIVVPNCGAEGLAAFVLHHINRILTEEKIGGDRGLYVQSVRAYEDEKNSATVSLQDDVVAIVADAIKRNTLSTAPRE